MMVSEGNIPTFPAVKIFFSLKTAFSAKILYHKLNCVSREYQT